MFQNLQAEMARKRITTRGLAKMTGLHENTLYRKIEGKVEFKLNEMEDIRRILRIEVPLDHLFKR